MHCGDLFFFLVVVVAFFFFAFAVSDDGGESMPFSVGVGVFCAWIVACVLGGIMYLADLGSNDTRANSTPVYSREAAKDLYGFENSTEYPLLLRKESSEYFSGGMRTGVFSSFMRVDGGQAITVEYQASDGNSYWINIPTSVIAWDKTGTTERPTMSIEFSSRLSFGTKAAFDSDGCDTKWSYLRLQCIREYDSVGAIEYNRSYTLPEIVQGNIKHVTIKISEKDYQEFFNGL